MAKSSCFHICKNSNKSFRKVINTLIEIRKPYSTFWTTKIYFGSYYNKISVYEWTQGLTNIEVILVIA